MNIVKRVYIITGANGFLGNNIIRKLELDVNNEIRAFVLKGDHIKSKYNPFIYNVNVNGTKNIIDKVLELKAKLIYISSVHAIPEKYNNSLITEITNFNPNNVHGLYAKTKAKLQCT